MNIYKNAEKYLEDNEDKEGKVDIYKALQALRILAKDIENNNKKTEKNKKKVTYY